MCGSGFERAGVVSSVSVLRGSGFECVGVVLSVWVCLGDCGSGF